MAKNYKLNILHVFAAITLVIVVIAAGINSTPAHAVNPKSQQQPAARTTAEQLQAQLNTPEVPKKASANIGEYMSTVKNTLNHNKMEANLLRGGEVVQTILPCEKLFASNSTDIKTTAQGYLKFFSSLLKYPNMYKVVIAVHSDNTGEKAYRQNLTAKRAEAIRSYLCKSSGTDGSNLVCLALSDQKPLAPDNNSIENRNRNRRVEVYIVPGEQMVSLASSGRLKF